MIYWAFTGTNTISTPVSQIFMHLSCTVQYMMRLRGFQIVPYVDDFIGFGTPTVAQNSFQAPCKLLQDLGFTLSSEKLVCPSTSAGFLGVLINTKEGTISIPPVKLEKIYETISEWSSKKGLQT